MADQPEKSLADRITKPLDAASTAFTPAVSTSWADEVASPIGPATPMAESSLADAQTDGAGEQLGGSGLHDAQYEVEVKLSELQQDENNPLYSVQSFSDLGM